MLPITRIATRSRSLLRPTIFTTQFRTISSVKVPPKDEESILISQRKNRPVSPDIRIYQKQLTSTLSGLHRITGVGLAVGFYGLTCSYAFASLLGVPLDSGSVVGLVAGLPVALTVLGKAIASFPFVFHTANGIRHLFWDFGKELTLPGVYRTGYAVLAATAIFGSYFAFFL